MFCFSPLQPSISRCLSSSPLLSRVLYKYMTLMMYQISRRQLDSLAATDQEVVGLALQQLNGPTG